MDGFGSPAIPGLGDASDAVRLRAIRRALQECVALLEHRMLGGAAGVPPAFAFGGSGLRSAASMLERSGVLPVGTVQSLAGTVSASALPFPRALSIASEHAHALMLGRLAPLLPSGGPVDAAVLPGLVRKASSLVAELAAFDAAAGSAASLCVVALGNPRRAPSAAASAAASLLRRWEREAEDSDPVAALASNRLAVDALRASSLRIRGRMRKGSPPRRRPRRRAPTKAPP